MNMSMIRKKQGLFHSTRIILLFGFALLGVNEMVLWATPSQGGRGLMYVHSALTLPKGHLESYIGIRYFGKVANFVTTGVAYTLWDVQIPLSFNYGWSKHLEIGFSPILYQDINRSGGNFWQGKANLPDDMLFGVKIGSFSGLESPWVFGGMVSVRIPTAKNHNIIYEPYSAGRVSAGVLAIGSYFFNPIFPEAGWSLHGNIGYWNHNDVGKKLSSVPGAPTPQAMSSEILAGFGALYPTGSFDFSAEIHARHFLSRPPVSAYTREYVSYFTFGVYYKTYPWLTIEMGFDKSLIVGEDLTDYRYVPPKVPNFPNFPSWRGVLGIKIGILPRSLWVSEADQVKQKVKDRKAVLEQMLKSEADVKTAEDELARIQAERKKIEEELERLRKLLETERQKKKE